MIPIGPYRPDMADTNAGVSPRVVNANPRMDGAGISYHPRRSLQVLSTSTGLPSAPRGAIAVVNRLGQFKGYFGTADSLYEMQADYTFEEIGTDFSLPEADPWAMAQYGEQLLVSNSADGMFAYNIETVGSVTAVTGAPKARFLFTAFECVFALDCDGNEYVMRNSAIGNYAKWSGGGAGAQEFPDGEALMGGGTLNDGVAGVLQRSAVHILTATGTSLVYNKAKVAEGVGAISSQSIVQAPGALYFVHSSGFYRLTASGLESIGEGKVNRTFFESLGVDGASSIQGAYDPERRQVAWRYKSTDAASDEVFQNILVFDINTGEFVEVETSTSLLVRMSGVAMTMEDLDAFGTMDELPFSLDSDAWKGGRPRLGAMDAGFNFGFFDGPTLAVEIDTSTSISTQSLLVTSAMPITDAAAITASLGVRARLADEVLWKPAAAMQPSGRVPLRGRGKALSLRLNIPADSAWTHLRGVDGLVFSEGGGR